VAKDFDFEIKTRKAEEIRKDLSRHKTEGGIFSYETLQNVGKLGSEGFIDRIKGPIATGKEADVFLGERGGEDIVIKIFRLSSASYFRKPTVLQYILGDERFRKIKRTPKDLIRSWALKEFRNLKKVEGMKINSPKPLAIEKNVLVMEFIGDDAPAPQLLKSDPEDVEEVFKTIVKQVRTMYKNNFVHADLSEYNILMKGDNPYFIDFGQGVLLTHPKAEEFLERDVRIICTFFRKLGVDCETEIVLKDIRKK
jgi:RIO kinase 1